MAYEMRISDLTSDVCASDLEERVYFQAFSNKIFLYENGEVKDLETPDVTLFSFKVNDQIIVQGLNKGLFILKNGEFNFWEGSQIFAGMPILAILPFSQDRLIIGTATNGLYLYDGTSFIPWITEASRDRKSVV